MKMETARERNRQALRYLRRERQRRRRELFAAIPRETRNLLREVMGDPRVKNPIEEATRRLGRRPTVVEWMWAIEESWHLVIGERRKA